MASGLLSRLLGVPTRQCLFLDSAMLQQQLKTEIPWDEAAPITGTATGLDSVLIDNPMVGGLTSEQLALGLAAVYGHMLLALEQTIADPQLPEVYRARVIWTRDRIAQITRLAQIELPAPPVTQDSTDDNTRQMSIDDVLDETLASEMHSEPSL